MRPACRAQGVGTALITAVRALAAELGIRTVALDVWSFNGRVRAFFGRRGFEPYNERMWLR